MKWLTAAVVSASLILAPVAFAASVNINTADAKTIDKGITGVGPKLAQSIIDYRAKNGPFKSVDDLTKVKGIGQEIVEKNRANLTVSK